MKRMVKCIFLGGKEIIFFEKLNILNIRSTFSVFLDV